MQDDRKLSAKNDSNLSRGPTESGDLEDSFDDDEEEEEISISISSDDDEDE